MEEIFVINFDFPDFFFFFWQKNGRHIIVLVRYGIGNRLFPVQKFFHREVWIVLCNVCIVQSPKSLGKGGGVRRSAFLVQICKKTWKCTQSRPRPPFQLSSASHPYTLRSGLLLILPTLESCGHLLQTLLRVLTLLTRLWPFHMKQSLPLPLRWTPTFDSFQRHIKPPPFPTIISTISLLSAVLHWQTEEEVGRQH